MSRLSTTRLPRRLAIAIAALFLVAASSQAGAAFDAIGSYLLATR